MADIPIKDAYGLITDSIVTIFKQKAKATTFLQSFGREKVRSTGTISVAVRRFGENIAVDVNRSSEGNRNEFSKGTVKSFKPPYYREYFEFTALESYQRALDSKQTNLTVDQIFQISEEGAEHLMVLVDKIQRAVELQAAQVFETGVLQLKDGGNIDFKRKAASMVDNTSSPWTSNSNDPREQLQAGANFIRTEGKYQGGIFNIVMGQDAISAFLNNDNIKNTEYLQNAQFSQLTTPQRDANGGVLHGMLSMESYKGYVWSYPEMYKDASGSKQDYVNPKKVFMTPTAPVYDIAYAGVPRLLGENGGNTTGKYVFGDYIDERNSSHVMDVKSAPIFVPTDVDTIWTGEVVS